MKIKIAVYNRFDFHAPSGIQGAWHQRRASRDRFVTRAERGNFPVWGYDIGIYATDIGLKSSLDAILHHVSRSKPMDDNPRAK